MSLHLLQKLSLHKINFKVKRSHAGADHRVTVTSLLVAATLTDWLHSLSRQRQRRRPSPLEHPVNEHAVLAQAPQGEAARLVVDDLQVSPWNEARVTHVYINGAVGRVPAYGDRPLAHDKLKVPAFESGQGLQRGSSETHGKSAGIGAGLHQRRTQEGERGLVICVRGHRDAHGAAWSRL